MPFASLNKINEELDKLEEIGVQSKVDNSEWTSPTVYVKKKSKEIRVCADFYTKLNNALKDYHYPLLRPEEIFAKFTGSIFFSKFDYSDTFFQIPVGVECSKLLCISTPMGVVKMWTITIRGQGHTSHLSTSHGHHS